MKSAMKTDSRLLRKSVIAGSLLATAASVILISGCATTDENFQVIVGSKFGSDVLPCADYASQYNYEGRRYYVVDPYTQKVTIRHKGMDFCKNTGSEVIAAANGIVVNLVQDNPYFGGRITLLTKIQYHDKSGTQYLHLDALHITPRDGLNNGDAVQVGQVIGYTQPPGKVHIGPRSHVHFSAGPTPKTWLEHTDPNQFWQKGPGIVSCFDPKNPPTDDQIVAPIKC